MFDEQMDKIAETTETKVDKLKSKADFLQLYVENLSSLYKLEKQDARVLLFILQNISFTNTITVNSTMRKNVAMRLEISLPTVSRALNSLIDKGILQPIIGEDMKEKYQAYTDDIYLISPNIVGNGPFRELKKLRYTIRKEYDSNKMEFISIVNAKFFYDGYEYIDKYEIIDEKSTQIDDKVSETEILIAEKENDKSATPMPKTTNVKSQNHYKSSPSSKDIGISIDDEVDKVVELANTRIEFLQLKIREAKLEIIKKLIDAGKIDEALELKRKFDKT